MDEVIRQSLLTVSSYLGIWRKKQSARDGFDLGRIMGGFMSLRMGEVSFMAWEMGNGKNGIAWYEQRGICGQWWEGWMDCFCGVCCD